VDDYKCSLAKLQLQPEFPVQHLRAHPVAGLRREPGILSSFHFPAILRSSSINDDDKCLVLQPAITTMRRLGLSYMHTNILLEDAQKLSGAAGNQRKRKY
jgi:hypothetical protein